MKLKLMNIVKITMICIIFIFFVIPNNSIVPQSLIMLVASGISIFLWIILYDKFFSKYISYLTILYIVFFCIALFLFSVSKNISFIINFIYITLMIFIIQINDDKLSEKYPKLSIKIILWLAILSMILQFLSNTSQRLVLSIGDANFTGLVVLLFFFLSIVTRFRFGILFSIVLTIALGSRNLFIAMLLFYFLKLLKVKYPRGVSFLTNPYILFILGNASIFLLSNFWVNNVGIEIQYQQGIGRLLGNYRDASNYGRFLANIEGLKMITSNFEISMLGTTYLENDISMIGLSMLPHNSLLYSVISTGIIFSVGYFLIVLHVIQKLKTIKNSEIVATYFLFSLFLHGLFSGIFLLVFVIILTLSNLRNTSSST